MSESYLLSQAFSAVALVLGASAYLERRETRLKLMLSASAACQAVHFVLLEATQGALQSSVTSLRFLVSGWRKSRAFFWIFLLLGLVAGVWKYRTPVDILPVMANCMACYAVFLSRGLALRYWLLAVTLCWFAYNAWNLSIVGCLAELIYALMNISVIRTCHRKTAAL